MLIIREAQLGVFREDAIQQLTEQLAADLQRGLPAHVQALGEQGTREAIRGGIDRAGTYGIITREGVSGYVKLMFLFGRDFDADPGLGWAGQVLNDASLPDEGERMRRLVQAAMDFARSLAEGDPGA
jgi:hypothetical protein